MYFLCCLYQTNRRGSADGRRTVRGDGSRVVRGLCVNRLRAHNSLLGFWCRAKIGESKKRERTGWQQIIILDFSVPTWIASKPRNEPPKLLFSEHSTEIEGSSTERRYNTCKLSVEIPEGVSPNLRAPPSLKIFFLSIQIWLRVLWKFAVAVSFAIEISATLSPPGR